MQSGPAGSGQLYSYDNRIMSEPCVCQPDMFPFFCARHRCEKTEHFLHLCRDREDYRRLWDEDRGPLQADGGIRCNHRAPFDSCRYCASVHRRGIDDPNSAPWPAGRLLAELIGNRKMSGTAVDLGCGVGALGLASIRSGCFITFQDHKAEILTTVARNAVNAGAIIARDFDTLACKWSEPPPLKFDNILGSEIHWWEKEHDNILRWLVECWTRKGVCLFSGSNPDGLRKFAALLPLGLKAGLSTLDDGTYAADVLEVTA